MASLLGPQLLCIRVFTEEGIVARVLHMVSLLTRSIFYRPPETVELVPAKPRPALAHTLVALLKAFVPLGI